MRLHTPGKNLRRLLLYSLVGAAAHPRPEAPTALGGEATPIVGGPGRRADDPRIGIPAFKVDGSISGPPPRGRARQTGHGAAAQKSGRDKKNNQYRLHLLSLPVCIYYTSKPI